MDKDDFKYLSQVFDSKVLDLVKQKESYPYKYMSSFEKFKKRLSSKEKYYSLMTDEQEVQLQGPSVLKSQREGYQFNQKLLHPYQHSKNQFN